jgi:hypothetical protein
MYPLPLTRAERRAFNAALVSSTRTLRFRARLYGKNDKPLGIEFPIAEGEVVGELSRDAPNRTAHVTLHDPGHRLHEDRFRARIWSSNLRIDYGVWVRSDDVPTGWWVDVPIFYGPITSAERDGLVVEVDAADKMANHLPPAVMVRPMSFRKHVAIHKLLRHFFHERGESRRRIPKTNRKLKKPRAYGLGAVPWRMAMSLVDELEDRQLYFRGDGVLSLRRLSDHVAWTFTSGTNGTVIDYKSGASRERVRNMWIVRGRKKIKVPATNTTRTTKKEAVGATNITVANNKGFASGRKIVIGTGSNKQTREITSVASNTIHFTKKALTRKIHEGIKVSVHYRQERTRTVIGKARLRDGHPFSAASLSNGKRPLVSIVDRKGVHKQKEAQQKANRMARLAKVGLHANLTVTCLTIPHLELGDVVLFKFPGINQRARVRKLSIPLNYGDSMELNWAGERVPKRPPRRRNRRR